MTSNKGRVARLTKSVVDSSGPEASRYVIWDDQLKGFGLRVEPTSVKTWILRYRLGGGRRGTLRQFTIARHGALTPDQARAEAKRLLAQVSLGQDPQAAKTAKREESTVSELCDLYLAEGGRGKKSSTLAIDKLRIANHIKPALGSKRVTSLERSDVERFIDDVRDGRIKTDSVRVRGGPGAAARSAGLLGGILKFAVDRKIVSENVATGVTRPKDNKRERFLTPAELGALGDALRSAELAGADQARVDVIRLLCLTGARKNEIARLSWSEVDLERGRLTLHDSKTGAKSVPLGAAARTIIEGRKRGVSNWVFARAGDASRPVNGIDWFWVTIREAAGLHDVRIHDLRHNFASFGLAGGATLMLLGKILGHSSVQSTHRYAHLADDPVRAAADRISGTIDAALSGKSGEIAPMRRGGGQ